MDEKVIVVLQDLGVGLAHLCPEGKILTGIHVTKVGADGNHQQLPEIVERAITGFSRVFKLIRQSFRPKLPWRISSVQNTRVDRILQVSTIRTHKSLRASDSLGYVTSMGYSTRHDVRVQRPCLVDDHILTKLPRDEIND